MNPALLLPAGLAALGALLLPLLIHLARRSQLRATPFAALRWLRMEARPQRRLKFEEWPLLLLRLLLLALLALWLARPVLVGGEEGVPVLAVAPGVDVAEARALAGPGGRALWLAPGFPPLDATPPDVPVRFASLLRQLDMELAPEAALMVVVPERLEGLDARRPALSRAVEWRVLPGAMPAAGASARTPPRIEVRAAGDDAPGVRYLRAAALSWHGAEPADDVFKVLPAAAPLDPDAAYLAWLGPGPLPDAVLAWVEAGGVVLLGYGVEVEFPAPPAPWWRDAAGGPVVEGTRLGAGRVLRFTRELSPPAMPALLEPEFPRMLRDLLEPPQPAPASAPAAEHAPAAGASAWPQPPRDLRPWLAALIGLLFLVERWMATSRRRAVRATIREQGA